MKKKQTEIGIVLLASYLIYRFYFSFIGNSIQQLVLFGFIGIYLVFHMSTYKEIFFRLGKTKSLIITAALLYGMILSFAFFVPLLYKTNDFSYLTSQLRYMSYTLSFIVLVDIVRVYLAPENLKDELARLYTVVSRNYVLVSILMLASSTIRKIWEKLIYVTPKQLELVYKHDAYYTRWGWAGYSGFAITLQMTIAVALIVYLMLKNINTNQKITVNQIVTLILLLIGNSFYGRVGLLTSLFIVGLATLYVVISKGKIILGVGMVTSLLVLFIGLTIFKEVNTAIEGWYNWAMDPIIDLFSTGKIQTSSTDSLLGMYFLPEWKTILFGDGFYMDPITGSYYMAVDVGFLRPMLFYGIFLTLIAYSIPVLLFFSLFILDKRNWILSALLILTMFVFELKGEVYMAIIPVAAMLYYSEAINSYQISNNVSEGGGLRWKLT